MHARLLILLLACLPLLGFRPVSPQERAREIIRKTESHFGIHEHAELYSYVRAKSDGSVYSGQMLIIFRYEDKEVNGVFRLLPDDDNEGVTLISLQPPGEMPTMAVYDHNTDSGGFVEPEKLRQKLGDTDWFFEGIYDDDKNPWRYKKTGSVVYRGQDANVIEARYSDPKLRDAVGYDYRRILVRQSDEQPLSSEFYNDANQLIYVIDLLNSEHFEYQGHEQSRTKQLQLIDFEEGSSTVLTRIRSNWNPQLPNKLFELSFAEKWDSETDELVVKKLLRDLPGEEK